MRGCIGPSLGGALVAVPHSAVQHIAPVKLSEAVAEREKAATTRPPPDPHILDALKRLVDRVVQLGTVPQSGRKVPEYSDSDLRELLSRPYRIIYRQRGNHLEVVTVMHYRRLPPVDPRDLA